MAPARLWPRAADALLVLIALATGGCQSYHAAPLDLPLHAEAFLSRTPASPEVAAFAASLEPSGEAARAPFDPRDGLTLREAELVALVFNRELRLARLHAGVTQASAEHAGLWEDPVFGVDLTRILESGAERPWEVFGSIGFTIPISGRLEIEKQRAGIEHATDLARVAAAEWRTRMAVRRAWVEWRAAELRAAAISEFLERLDSVLSIVDAMERAGETSRVEARLFRIERASRAAEVPAARARSARALAELRSLLGLPPHAGLDLRGDGIGDFGAPPALEAMPDPASLVLRSPSLLVAIAEYEVAERTLELEIRKQFPDIQLTPGYGTQDGQRQFTMGISVPIPILNGNRRAIAEAHARRELARARAETDLERLLGAIADARLRAAAAASQCSLLEQDLVPLVDGQYADARRLAQLGEVASLVLIESLSRQLDAKLRLIDARAELAVASIDLEELVGPEHPR